MAAKNENEKRLTKEEKEMQLLLDSMLVPFSDYRKNLAANRKLEPLDEDKKLLKIVSDLERMKKDDNKDDKKENISKRLDLALEDIAKMMNMYGGDKNNVGYASGQPHKRVLPFLVQQVLFYIAALCIECWWDKSGISGKWNRCKVYFQFSDWQILTQYDNICLR